MSWLHILLVGLILPSVVDSLKGPAWKECASNNEAKGWRLGMRVYKGSRDSPYSMWLSNTPVNDDEETCASWSVSSDVTTSLKSRLVETEWHRIKEVRLAMYTKRQLKSYIDFDVHGATKSNFMSQARIKRSSYSDIKTASSQFFSVFGLEDGRATRRFYAQHIHSGCPNDRLWMADIDTSRQYCSWEQCGYYPCYFYSTLSTHALPSHLAQADLLVIQYRTTAVEVECSQNNKVNGWQLGMRVYKGSRDSPYSMWLSNTPVNDGEETCASWSVSSDVTTSLKSRLVESDWHRIKEVRIAMYTRGQMQAHIDFSTRGSSKIDFMTQSRVLRSTYTDIQTATSQFFGVRGLKDGRATRRFYAQHIHNGCPNDRLWMADIDSSRQYCSWEQCGYYPCFLYSTLTTHALPNRLGVADVFVVLYRT